MPREGLLYDRTLLARLDHSRAGLRMSGGAQQCQGVGVVRAARDGGRDEQELGREIVARAVGEREEKDAVRWHASVAEDSCSHGQRGGLAAASARVDGDAGSWIGSGHDLLVGIQPTQGVDTIII